MNSEQLAGKTALITGAAKRIGRETALSLAGEGANVIVHYRGSVHEAADLCREIRAKGVESWIIQADFEKPAEYETLIQRALDEAGRLDILVNNASIFPPDKLDDITWESLLTNIQVNAWVPFVLARDFKRLVGRGMIINMLDSRIKDADWNHVAYILSKHVLAALTKMMALDYAPDIRVNAVAPGLILPPPGKDESYIDALKDTVPLRKHGDPQDVADAIVYLAKSDFLTGEVIFVDGGRHLREYNAQRSTSNVQHST